MRIEIEAFRGGDGGGDGGTAAAAMVEEDEPKTLLVDVRLEDGSDASLRVRRRAEELGAR